jgi:hypothetical protein
MFGVSYSNCGLQNLTHSFCFARNDYGSLKKRFLASLQAIEGIKYRSVGALDFIVF